MRFLLALLLMAGCMERQAPSPVDAHASVHVYAAASLSEALTEIAHAYQKQSGQEIVFNFGASSLLARQIQRGAPADLFLSADEAQMDTVRTLQRASVLSNKLVIVVPADDGQPLSEPRQLAEPRIATIALAEPSSVPAGIYARTWLTQAGIWKAVAPKVVPTDNVRGALAAVAAGNADAAIVYRTDARISNRVRIAFEVRDGPPISYPFGLLADRAEARRFFDYLRARPALDVFARHGFDVLR
jgi:molybdate transport system substrate-binding protein